MLFSSGEWAAGLAATALAVNLCGCEEMIIEISIKRSRQRGLTKRYKLHGIDWGMLGSYLEGLSDLFSKGRKFKKKDLTEHNAELESLPDISSNDV